MKGRGTLRGQDCTPISLLPAVGTFGNGLRFTMLWQGTVVTVASGQQGAE